VIPHPFLFIAFIFTLAIVFASSARDREGKKRGIEVHCFLCLQCRPATAAGPIWGAKITFSFAPRLPRSTAPLPISPKSGQSASAKRFSSKVRPLPGSLSPRILRLWRKPLTFDQLINSNGRAARVTAPLFLLMRPKRKHRHFKIHGQEYGHGLTERQLFLTP
jgi:hypothetical protein